MKILDAGHKYLLDTLDGGLPQQLTFVKRMGENFPFNFGKYPGTNCQEVLRALIDRTEYLNKQKPCVETQLALECLRTALFLYESRAARRHGRQLDLRSKHDLMWMETCETCKHVGCNGKCNA